MIDIVKNYMAACELYADMKSSFSNIRKTGAGCHEFRARQYEARKMAFISERF